MTPGEDAVDEVTPTSVAPGRAIFSRTAELSDSERDAVRQLSLAVYPPEAIAAWPGRHIEWSSPESCVRVFAEDALASYVGVYVREGRCDGHPVRIGGVGNVKTHPAARRRGLAAVGIRRVLAFFHDEAAVHFALLVCEPRLLGYYGGLGWREFAGRLFIRQHGETSQFMLDRVMIHPVQSEAPASGDIDLCGPPW
jgi:GNAT superfamily N-acetyltransferase